MTGETNGFFFTSYFSQTNYFSVCEGEQGRVRGAPPAPRLFCVCHHHLTTESFTALSAAPPELSLGIGGAAEHFVRRLNDGVAVDAEDPEQLVRLPAARDLGDGQTVHGEPGLVHNGRAHRLSQAT